MTTVCLRQFSKNLLTKNEAKVDNTCVISVTSCLAKGVSAECWEERPYLRPMWRHKNKVEYEQLHLEGHARCQIPITEYYV